jgi:GH15 family glucan-1,4-alpha-glucosidase
MTPDELLGLVNETARFWRGWLCDHWDQPQEGVWETRGGRQNFTYG